MTGMLVMNFHTRKQSIFMKLVGIFGYFIPMRLLGHGKAWMEKNVGEVYFKKDTVAQNIISFVSGVVNWNWDRVKQEKHIHIPTSFVPGMNSIHLDKDFMGWTPIHVAHELGHVSENKMAGNLAVYFGGGAGDASDKVQGGDPSGIRWMNENFANTMPQFALIKSPHEYGNTSSADYYAESSSAMIYRSVTSLPATVVLWLQALIDVRR